MAETTGNEIASVTIDTEGMERAIARAAPARLRQVVNHYGHEVQRQAQANLQRNKSIDTADLSNSMFVEIVGTSGGAAAKIGPSAEYGPHVEFGTGPHVIVPKRGKYLRFKGRGGKIIFTKRVEHRGSPAKPFLRPAFQAVRNPFEVAIANLVKG